MGGDYVLLLVSCWQALQDCEVTLIKLVDKLRKKRASGNEDTELKAADLEPLDDMPNIDGSLVRHMQAMISLNLIRTIWTWWVYPVSNCSD